VRGGALETVVDCSLHPNAAPTGTFYHTQTVEGVRDAIASFEPVESDFDPGATQAHARQFDTTVFTAKMRVAVDHLMAQRTAVASA
jgi:hypothetical protein